MEVMLSTGILYLDFFYYLFVIFSGPVLLWYLLVFRRIQKQLHETYIHTGVKTTGIATEVLVTVTRGTITRIERRREYSMRYAYKAPGTNTIYVKNFVTVKQVDCNRRLFDVLVLPGQPKTGVPEFLIEKAFHNRFFLAFDFAYCFAALFYCVLLFANLFAKLFDNCIVKSYSMDRVCTPSGGDVCLSIFSCLVVGLAIEWCLECERQRKVPGTVYQVHQRRDEVSAVHVGTAQVVGQNDALDTRIIPMAEAWATFESLEPAEDGNDMEEFPVANAVGAPVTLSKAEEPQAELEEAQVLELV